MSKVIDFSRLKEIGGTEVSQEEPAPTEEGFDYGALIMALREAHLNKESADLQLSLATEDLVASAEDLLNELAEYEETHTPYQYNACLRAVGITKKDIEKLHKLVGDNKL